MVLICWATGKRHLIWYSKSEQTTKSWYQFPDLGLDDYQFYLDAGPLSNLINFTVKTMNFGNS
jgi:hypothetical protein